MDPCQELLEGPIEGPLMGTGYHHCHGSVPYNVPSPQSSTFHPVSTRCQVGSVYLPNVVISCKILVNKIAIFSGFSGHRGTFVFPVIKFRH